jgi:hypothetical protein
LALSRAPRRFECFYVYPTVSREQTANADLRVQQAEIAAAIVQASRFSATCRVWASIYRQATGQGLADTSPTELDTAYESLLSALGRLHQPR